MKRMIDGVEIKYTAAGYVYKAGRKVSALKVNPICWPSEVTSSLTSAENDALAEMVSATWVMC